MIGTESHAIVITFYEMESMSNDAESGITTRRWMMVSFVCRCGTGSLESGLSLLPKPIESDHCGQNRATA